MVASTNSSAMDRAANFATFIDSSAQAEASRSADEFVNCKDATESGQIASHKRQRSRFKGIRPGHSVRALSTATVRTRWFANCLHLGTLQRAQDAVVEENQEIVAKMSARAALACQAVVTKLVHYSAAWNCVALPAAHRALVLSQS